MTDSQIKKIIEQLENQIPEGSTLVVAYSSSDKAKEPFVCGGCNGSTLTAYGLSIKLHKRLLKAIDEQIKNEVKPGQ